MHMAQLLDACLGLETAINTALTTAGLDTLRAMLEAGDDSKTGRNATPRCLVSLAGGRDRSNEAMGGVATSTVERLDATFTVEAEGTERAALSYEGVVAGVLRGSQSAVSAAVTDATVDWWALAPGSLDRDEERRNSKVGWLVTIPVTVQLQW